MRDGPISDTRVRESVPGLTYDTSVMLGRVTAAVRSAILEHKRAGNPISTWRDGKVVWIPADELELPDVD
ncbi:MAG: hypothetical protein ACLQVD_06765 [Capsulimonadaceae bacterium]